MTGKSWKPSHEPPRGRGERHLSHFINSEKREGRERECLKTCSHEKTMLTVNTIAVKAANTSQSRSPWNPAASTNLDTADNYGAWCTHKSSHS